MKILLIRCIFFIGISLLIPIKSVRAQNSTSTNGLNIKMSPLKNRGYITWEGNGASKYRVDVYQNNQLMHSATTKRNYVKLDPLLFNMDGITAIVTSLSPGGTDAGKGDVYANEVPPGWQPDSLLCVKNA